MKNLKYQKVIDDDCCLPFNIIEFVQFNYDGKGTAIIMSDDGNDFDYLNLNHVNMVINGGFGRYGRHYKLIK